MNNTVSLGSRSYMKEDVKVERKTGLGEKLRAYFEENMPIITAGLLAMNGNTNVYRYMISNR